MVIIFKRLSQICHNDINEIRKVPVAFRSSMYVTVLVTSYKITQFNFNINTKNIGFDIIKIKIKYYTSRDPKLILTFLSSVPFGHRILKLKCKEKISLLPLVKIPVLSISRCLRNTNETLKINFRDPFISSKPSIIRG